MMLWKYVFFRRIGCRDLITLLLADIQEFRIEPELSADQRHIARTCIMIVIMKPVRIDEIGIIAAKAFTFFVHLLDEPVVIMSGIFSDIFRLRISCFIR